MILSDLKRPLSQLTEQKQLALLSELRMNRHISKGHTVIKREKREAKSKVTRLQNIRDSLTEEQRLLLIDLLEKQLGDKV